MIIDFLKVADLRIEDFAKKTRTSIDNVGFLFGAGTSFESGYPLVSGLTKSVIDALSVDDNASLEEVLDSFGLKYDAENGEPNIEDISDMVIEHYTNSQQDRFFELRENIRALVRDAILGIENPDISNHVRFLERIKARAFERPTEIWVFTTNYDMLFEEACAEVGVRLVNGFVGASTRYFSEREFSLISGVSKGVNFSQEAGLTVRLVKLHGSVSWYKKGDRFFESGPFSINDSEDRCMVLPRRTKVIETLSSPYDRLFRISSNTIGAKCKCLISSGFSYSDSHINETLITPKVEDGSISFVNFCQFEPPALVHLRERKNIQHVCSDKLISGGVESELLSDTWKFSEFVKLF